MPIIIPKGLPAYKSLSDEKIFVMDEARAVGQDIRPIEIAILNLMPTKETTETQLIRLLSNSPLQINVTLIKTDSYEPTHVSIGHMIRFYKSLDEIKKMKFDGMIVTGAPVETIPFGTNLNKSLTLPTKTSQARFIFAGGRKLRFITSSK